MSVFDTRIGSDWDKLEMTIETALEAIELQNIFSFAQVNWFNKKN
jgi:hypothetical protein